MCTVGMFSVFVLYFPISVCPVYATVFIILLKALLYTVLYTRHGHTWISAAQLVFVYRYSMSHTVSQFYDKFAF